MNSIHFHIFGAYNTTTIYDMNFVDVHIQERQRWCPHTEDKFPHIQEHQVMGWKCFCFKMNTQFCLVYSTAQSWLHKIQSETHYAHHTILFWAYTHTKYQFLCTHTQFVIVLRMRFNQALSIDDPCCHDLHSYCQRELDMQATRLTSHTLLRAVFVLKWESSQLFHVISPINRALPAHLSSIGHVRHQPHRQWIGGLGMCTGVCLYMWLCV